MKYALVALALMFSTPGLAQHGHAEQKGPKGGQMQDVAGVHLELLTSGTTITINVYDESNKPLATGGYSGSALIVAGPERETVPLTPTGENALAGNTKKALGAGSQISVTLRTAAGKSGQARFKP